MTPSDPFDFSDPVPGDGAAAGPSVDRQFGDSPQMGNGWSSASAAAAVAGPAGPPLIWLGASAISGIAAIVLAALLGGSILFAVIAWLLGGPVGIGLVAVFSLTDTRQRAKAFYSSPASTRVLYVIALALVMIGVIAAALRIALYVGRM